MRVPRLGGIAVLLLAAQCALVCAKVTLDLQDNFILPDSKWGAGDGEANAILGDLVFINGEAGKLVVVNTKDYKSTVTDSYQLGSTGTSVATCSTGDENLVAAGSLGKDGKKGAGEVAIFSVDIKTGKLTFKRQISTVGSLPDHIIWAKKCRVIVAAIDDPVFHICKAVRPILLDEPLVDVRVSAAQPPLCARSAAGAATARLL